MRAFVAVDLAEASREQLARTVERLRCRSPSARWVGEGSFHLTLAFLGEIEADLVAAMRPSPRAPRRSRPISARARSPR